MTSLEWKEKYLELDEYYTDFLCKWRKHDFTYPEQYAQNQKIISDLMEFSHDIIFYNDPVRELLFENLEPEQRRWIEIAGLKTDMAYLRYIPVLLYKMQAKIELTP